MFAIFLIANLGTCKKKVHISTGQHILSVHYNVLPVTLVVNAHFLTLFSEVNDDFEMFFADKFVEYMH